MYRSQILFLTAVLLAALGIGCAKKSPVGDDVIANDIKAKLYSDPVTKPANIDVTVKGGAVTLGGDVPGSDVELEAVKLANGSAGVTSVSDQMKVDAAANTAPAPGTASAPNVPPPGAAPAPAPSAPVGSAPVPNNPAAPPVTPMEPKRHEHPVEQTATIPAGARVSVRTIDPIDSKTNTEGQTFRASLDSPLTFHDRVVVPAGAPVTIVLASAKGAGRIKGNSELEVRLVSIEDKGKTYPVDSSVVQEQGKSTGKSTAVKTGIGVAAGAIIGALAGGGKGAAIGSAAGGGAGFGYSVFTRGPQVKIPSETVLTFQLQDPLTLPLRREH